MEELPILQVANPDENPVSEKERVLGTISQLLSYPGEHYVQLVEMLYLIVQNEIPKAAKGISEFGQFVEACSDVELEEAYTRTFDVNPDCALEIGWHLFGEDYTRGQFLVRMRQELAKYEIVESGELPDHLTHALQIIAAMPEEEAQRFSHACVFPGLYKMQKSLKKNQSPYLHLIQCLLLVLEKSYGASEPWGENEDKLLRNSKSFPGQNGPRPPGGSDPLRSFPMPAAACSGHPQLVQIDMNYQAPKTGSDSNDSVPTSDARKGRTS